MKVGDKFSSFEEIKQCINDYEQNNFIQLYKRDCRTLETMIKKLPNRLKNVNESLKYYLIVYACNKGGKNFITRSKGLRSGNTVKHDCEMRIRFGLSSDNNYLIIQEMCETHNHPISFGEFINFPKQRRLNVEEMSGNFSSHLCFIDSVIDMETRNNKKRKNAGEFTISLKFTRAVR